MPPFRHRPGYPLWSLWGRPILGYGDGNGDGIIESSEVMLGGTVVWLGSAWPTQGGALATGVTLWDRIRISGLLEYRAGHVVLNETARWRCLLGVCPELYRRASPLDRQAAAAVLFETPAGYIEDGDYLKLRELSLTVTAPRSVVRAVRARGLRLALVGRNLATWTVYSGFDPEVNSLGYGDDIPYSDWFPQPPVRTWSLRLDVEY